MDCPDCRAELARVVGTRGLRHPCPACGGVAMGLEVLDRSLGTEIDYGQMHRGAGARSCPSCGEALHTLNGPGGTALGVCPDCELAWVDGEAQARLPWASAAPAGDRCRRCGAPWVAASDGSCRCCHARRATRFGAGSAHSVPGRPIAAG